MAAHLTNFEIYGGEPERLAEFYAALFGWRIEKTPGVDYWRIEVGADAPALATGGLTHPPGFGSQGWLPFVQVSSCAEALATAEHLGGTVLKERTAVPRVAWHGVIADPAGNRFLVWEPDPTAFPPPEPD
jgi:predicted enzyme related to lactoylglutathione lyase